MGIIGLNTINLDGGNIIKKGGGSMPTPDTPSKPKWTGHVDTEGLRAIGWTDEDIAYYQATGVNWDEEYDEYHKVTDDNKALYGVLTASNVSSYRDRIVYLPKIDTSDVASMDYKFYGCRSLIAMPMLDTSNVTSMNFTFNDCYSLMTIPPLDTSNVTNMSSIFVNCYSLITIPMLDTSNVTWISFKNCNSLKSIPILDTSNINLSEAFYGCRSLTTTPVLDMINTTTMSNMFYDCYSLTNVNIKNVKMSFSLSTATLFSKASLLYLINNEAATSAITIKLASYAYNRWATDPDIVAALANHPNISISK